MKNMLLDIVFSFLHKEKGEITFVNKYIAEWKKQGAAGQLPINQPLLDATLSSIFILADSHNPDEDRKEYEYDDKDLRQAIRILLIHNGFLEGGFSWDALPRGMEPLLNFYTEERKKDPAMNPKNYKQYRIALEDFQD